MTSDEMLKKMSQKLGRSVKVGMGTEYDHIIGFRLRPGQMLCVVKDTGEVLWEDDLPDKWVPRGEGKIYLLD